MNSKRYVGLILVLGVVLFAVALSFAAPKIVKQSKNRLIDRDGSLVGKHMFNSYAYKPIGIGNVVFTSQQLAPSVDDSTISIKKDFNRSELGTRKNPGRIEARAYYPGTIKSVIDEILVQNPAYKIHSMRAVGYLEIPGKPGNSGNVFTAKDVSSYYNLDQQDFIVMPKGSMDILYIFQEEGEVRGISKLTLYVSLNFITGYREKKILKGDGSVEIKKIPLYKEITIASGMMNIKI